jgi:hypothetical protein
MTEAEWLVCNDPLALGRFAHGKANPQRFGWLALDWGQRNQSHFLEHDSSWFDQYSLWLQGCGPHPNRLVWPQSFYPLGRWLHFDPHGAKFFGALRSADDPMRAAAIAGESASQPYSFTKMKPLDAKVAHKGRSKSKRAAQSDQRQHHFEEQHRQQMLQREQVGGEFCNQFRDIFGNPFRPIVVDPAWLTPKVVAIATIVYADRTFDSMPILADALEEAGCVNADLVVHCRGAGPHVRGCWVIDLLLGKE